MIIFIAVSMSVLTLLYLRLISHKRQAGIWRDVFIVGVIVLKGRGLQCCMAWYKEPVNKYCADKLGRSRIGLTVFLFPSCFPFKTRQTVDVYKIRLLFVGLCPLVFPFLSSSFPFFKDMSKVDVWKTPGLS